MATPITVDLTATAACLLQLRPRGLIRSREEEVAYYALLDSWEALTGLTGPDALAYADAVADRSTPVTAVVPPF